MKKAFGNPINGEWVCLGCGYSILPRRLHEQQDSFEWGTGASALQEGYIGPKCPECGKSLEYDDAE